MPLTREFSWSYSRHRCFNFCKTAYRLRYLDSWEGWDRFAAPEAKLLYELKNLKTAKSWTEQTFSESVREVFIRSRRGFEKFGPTEIRKAALRRLRADWAGMLAGEWKSDPKKLNLAEFYYSDAGARHPFNVQGIADSLSDRIAKLADAPVFAELARISYLDYRDFKRPDSFEVDGIKVWAAPDFVYSLEDGTLNVLNYFGGPPAVEGAWDFRAAVAVLFAVRKFNTSEDRINSRSLFLGQGDDEALCVYAYRNLCEVRRIINDSAVEMLEFENSQNADALKGEFHEGKCGNCEFRKFCQEFTKLRITN